MRVKFCLQTEVALLGDDADRASNNLCIRRPVKKL